MGRYRIRRTARKERWLVSLYLPSPIKLFLMNHKRSVQGERYFTCRPSYGAFVRPEKVTVGDYPVVDPFEEDEEI